jgi:hypothetical protein
MFFQLPLGVFHFGLQKPVQNALFASPRANGIRVDRQSTGDAEHLLATNRCIGLTKRSRIDAAQTHDPRGGIARRLSARHAGSERPVQLAAIGYRNAAGPRHARSDICAKRQPASNANSDDRSGQSGPTVKEMNDEAKRKIEREGK